MLSSFARIAIALLISAWAGLASAQTTTNPPASTPSDDGIDQAVQDQLLQQAVDQVKAHLYADAINGPLAQIIHTYEAAYAKSKKRIYCAETTTETLFYLASAAQDKKEARVLGKPTWALAYYLRGYAYGSLGKFADAEASLKQALVLSPYNSQYLSELGNVYENQKDWPKAMKAFQDADDAAIAAAREDRKIPLRCHAIRGQGFVLVELHRLDDATKKYQECLSLNPGDTASMRELLYIQEVRDKGAK